MNYQRILISEAEKRRILGMHGTSKSNPTTRLINEQAVPTKKEFPLCVRNASSTLARIGDLYYIYVKKTAGGAYLWGKAQGTDGAKIMYDLTKDQVSGATNDNGVVVLSNTYQTGYKYYCRCDNGSCRPKKYEDKELRKDECGDDNPCKPCGPEYRKGCKDPGARKGKPVLDGIIYKVQGCIGAKQDSFFGPDTEKKLKEKTGKITFNENEVDVICKGQTPGGQTPGGQEGTTPGDIILIDPNNPGNSKMNCFFEKLVALQIISRIPGNYKFPSACSTTQTANVLPDDNNLKTCFTDMFNVIAPYLVNIELVQIKVIIIEILVCIFGSEDKIPPVLINLPINIPGKGDINIQLPDKEGEDWDQWRGGLFPIKEKPEGPTTETPPRTAG